MTSVIPKMVFRARRMDRRAPSWPAEIWAKAAVAASKLHKAFVGMPARIADVPIDFVLIPSVAFALYWFSALIIVAMNRQHLFGSDAVLYVWLADPQTFERIGSFYNIDRITRFHPTTTAMAWVWMKVFSPLVSWMSPQQLLRTMFAAVGAVGVWAAMTAFAAFVPRRQVTLWGIIYAVSLGVWFFSGIEECKIVTATLAGLYLVAYLRLRRQWTTRGALALTAILLVACLNEIVAAFLIVIPAVDTLVSRGWNLRCGRWIAVHGLAAPLAFALLEGVVRPYTAGATTEGYTGEAVSHLGMLIFYLKHNDFSWAGLYGFLSNWLFFNVAAPTNVTTFAALPDWPQFQGFFEPSLANFASSPLSSILAVVFGVILAASLAPLLRREKIGGDLAGVLLGLLAYALLRGGFYFVVNARECFLYSSGTTLAHLLMLGTLFAASNFPAKQTLLCSCALLLFIINGTFIIGS
jgi:hypothetical protein